MTAETALTPIEQLLIDNLGPPVEEKPYVLRVWECPKCGAQAFHEAPFGPDPEAYCDKCEFLADPLDILEAIRHGT